ncbi:colanic acid exporter [Mycetocola lacteus]|uniref:Colanic acid exporter n=1 Tax=Mycetocola lacteus TaxID=76637 RepID=A0A3L7AUI0_9MICO|nr:MOP flippase family protein [Mycetocola lacteus]RLP83675.1 colanic acid exporter [Mycetocola lacteus]
MNAAVADTGHGAKAFGGAVWLGASTGLNSLLQFAQIVILARLLTGTEVGVVAILVIVVSVIDMFTDLGMSNALIQKKNITQSDVSSVYWFNVGVGFLLAVSAFFAAAPLAALYNEPALEGAIRWISLVFLISPHGQVFRGLLEREHRFRPVGVSEAASGITGVILTIVGALLGWGVFSYVLGRVANAAVRTGLLQLFARSAHHRITFAFHPRRAFSLLRFGAIQTVDALVSFVHNSVGTLVVGRMVSVSQLGGFNLAFNLAVNLPGTVNGVFSRAAFPSLSRMQDDEGTLVRGYLKLLRVTGFVNFPVLVGLALVAQDLVPVLFGDRWTWIVQIVQILAIGGCVRALTSPLSSLFMSVGRPEVSLIVNVVRTTLVLGGVLLTAATGGTVAVALVVSAGAAVTLLLNMVILKWRFRIGFGMFLMAILRPTLLVLPMAVSVWGAHIVMNGMQWTALLALAVEVLVGAFVFVGTVLLTKDSIGQEILQNIRRIAGR